MNPQANLPGLISTSEQYIPGMSDDEELRRAGFAYANDGVGDVIFAEMQTDALELGLRQET